MEEYRIKELPRGLSLVLGSASPRRRELLGGMGLDFTVRVSEADENLPSGTHPREAVRLLAVRKAEAVAASLGENTVVLAADTLVALGSEALGKPRDAEDACAMLRALSGRTHEVYTGVALMLNGRCVSDADATAVRFRDLTDAEIADYVATGEPMDKAGAYGIQGLGGRLVAATEGAFDNVVGLPCRLVDELLFRLLSEVGAL